MSCCRGGAGLRAARKTRYAESTEPNATSTDRPRTVMSGTKSTSRHASGFTIVDRRTDSVYAR